MKYAIGEQPSATVYLKLEDCGDGVISLKGTIGKVSYTLAQFTTDKEELLIYDFYNLANVGIKKVRLTSEEN